jgi:hypothetical protein
MLPPSLGSNTQRPMHLLGVCLHFPALEEHSGLNKNKQKCTYQEKNVLIKLTFT